jgi:hypothetical protein
MSTAAYIREHAELMQHAVNSCLNRARLCNENHGGHSEQFIESVTQESSNQLI